MKPGEQIYMSIKFRENMEMQRSCPHCGTENKALEGQATIWRVLRDRCHFIWLMKSSLSCQVTYKRIVDLNEEDTTEDRTPRSPQSPPKHDITVEEFKYCFRQLILTAPAPRRSPALPRHDYSVRVEQEPLIKSKSKSSSRPRSGVVEVLERSAQDIRIHRLSGYYR
jgi:hypothetical protein